MGFGDGCLGGWGVIPLNGDMSRGHESMLIIVVSKKHTVSKTINLIPFF